MAKKTTQETKLNIYRIVCIILALILIVVLILYGRNLLTQSKAEKKLEEMASQVNDVSDMNQSYSDDTYVSESLGLEIPRKNLNWEALHKENGDIYAWIYIPNTMVDYPILQHPTDDTYYLEHNIDGSTGYPGCIYTELQNSKDFSDFNTLIYGHNMKSGKMFRTLHDFEDSTFFNENRYIYIYTEEQVLVYEIFAAYERDDAHILNTNDFSKRTGCMEYIESLERIRDMSAHVRSDVELTAESNIITLSTCTGSDDRRYLVQAVLINDNFEWGR